MDLICKATLILVVACGARAFVAPQINGRNGAVAVALANSAVAGAKPNIVAAVGLARHASCR